VTAVPSSEVCWGCDCWGLQSQQSGKVGVGKGLHPCSVPDTDTACVVVQIVAAVLLGSIGSGY
jgi:hypothetical protein